MIVFKDNVNEWVTFACDGTGPADESKRTKRDLGWSRLKWLGGILIIISLHIHFDKLLMPFSLVAALPIRCNAYKTLHNLLIFQSVIWASFYEHIRCMFGLIFETII